jgi:PhnB protein
MAFHPYLNFPGTAREAMTRYQEVLGGELHVMGSADMPSNGEMPPDWDPDLVIHAALMVEGGGMLMASDAPGAEGGAAGTYVSYDAKDVDDARRVFEALSEGGEVEMEFQETFWSPGFGSFRDRWGTLWMVGAPSDFEMPG